MTDIIERLRSRSPYLHGSSAERTMAEAAAEIERLLADNKQLRDDFWKERERIDLLRAEIERLKAEIKWLYDQMAAQKRTAGAAALEPKP